MPDGQNYFIESCPVGCKSEFETTDIFLPEGALRRCVICGQLISQCSENAYDNGMKEFEDPVGTIPLHKSDLKRLKRRTRKIIRAAGKILSSAPEDIYLLELVRYIHLNPLRVKMVPDYKSLSRFPYCGHSVILGRRKRKWQDSKFVLRLFGSKEGTARRSYREFVGKGIKQGRRPDLTGGGLLRSHGGWEGVKALRISGDYQKGDERILGDGDFVNEVLSQAAEKFEQKYRLRAEG